VISNLDRYQRIAPFYDLLDLPFEQRRYRALRPLLFGGLSGRLLDAGVGTGRNFPFYPPGVSAVIGIDLSPRMLARAERRRDLSPIPIELRQMDVTKIGEFEPCSDPRDRLAGHDHGISGRPVRRSQGDQARDVGEFHDRAAAGRHVRDQGDYAVRRRVKAGSSQRRCRLRLRLYRDGGPTPRPVLHQRRHPQPVQRKGSARRHRSNELRTQFHRPKLTPAPAQASFRTLLTFNGVDDPRCFPIRRRAGVFGWFDCDICTR